MIPAFSLSALHTLLDISASTDPKYATVLFCYEAHCAAVRIRIYAGAWTANTEPDWVKMIFVGVVPEIIEKLLCDVKAFLEPENIARVAAEKRASRVAKLEQQLQETKA